MDGDILYDMTIGLFLKLIDFSTTLFDFLFYEIDVLNVTFSVWQLLGGTALIVMLVAWLIKKVVPVV